jgi:hypothetical protein
MPWGMRRSGNGELTKDLGRGGSGGGLATAAALGPPPVLPFPPKDESFRRLVQAKCRGIFMTPTRDYYESWTHMKMRTQFEFEFRMTERSFSSSSKAWR